MLIHGDGFVQIRSQFVPDQKVFAISDHSTDEDFFRIYGNGEVRAKSLKLTLYGWADHVFKEDHKLLPLDSLESYVKENQHLPNVPSEQEMLEKEHDVAETDAMLMEKIEELTLYLIELNKEVKALKARNEELEVEI